MASINSYLRLFRVHQYVKNVFVFTPLFFEFQFTLQSITQSLIAFILFCVVSSCVYIYNDMIDVEEDRLHHKKKRRPFAAQEITIKEGKRILVVLLLASLLTAYLWNIEVFYVFMAYVLINLAYTLILKRVPMVDVLIIGIGFVLRVLAGSYATSIPPSIWLIVMTLILALFLGFTKRRSDYLNKKDGQRVHNLKFYTKRRLDVILNICSVIIIILYIYYTITNDVRFRLESDFVFLTSIWVILGIFRYLKVLYKSKSYVDPSSIVLKDLGLKLILFCWISHFLILHFI